MGASWGEKLGSRSGKGNVQDDPGAFLCSRKQGS